MTVNKTASAVAWCPVHGKLSYTSRKRAKAVARLHPGHKSTYRCDPQPHLWHVGELHPKIISGQTTREEMDRRRRTVA